jgi:hypothetical protein
VLRKIFVPKKGEVREQFRILHDKDLNNFGTNRIPVVKSSRLRWAVHLTRMGEKRMHTEFWWGNLFENDRMEDREEDGRTTPRWKLGKCDVRMVLARDRIHWWVLVLAVLDLGFLL